MSEPKLELKPKDRLITALQSIKLKVIELATEIDKQQEYIERLKDKK